MLLALALLTSQLAVAAVDDAPAPPPRAAAFAGLWQTTYGRMRIAVTGEEAAGSYDYGSGGTVRGALEGDTFTFAYTEPEGIAGTGEFHLAEDGQSFAGTWRRTSGVPEDRQRQRAWTGTRVQPVADRTWLVVLEAHWESSLAEPEYSYGRMLREFFSRLPDVEVRHRWFHDEADLRRFAAETAYLAEPVVLYISTHGTQSGITVGGATLGAKVVAESLAQSNNLMLLHLGGCLMMEGDMPGEIQRQLGKAAPFPISGFLHEADWGGSAIVDFTYLDLVLGRGMAPEAAVAATQEMLTFARADGDPAAPIAPAGLVIRLP